LSNSKKIGLVTAWQCTENATHFQTTLLIFHVAKIAGIILLLMSFSYYVVAHGTCNTLDSGLVKCEIASSKSEPCSDAHHTNDDSTSEPTIHACGCSSVFVPVVSQIAFGNATTDDFDPLILDMMTSEFIQRIERPPIANS